jgi:hypothetical protein
MRITLKLDFNKDARLALAHYYGLKKPASRKDLISHCEGLIESDFQNLVGEYNKHQDRDKNTYGADEEDSD